MVDSKLETERHIKYWQRCLKTLLPTQYTSTDSSRMTLGFFILSALNLLSAGADSLPPSERTKLRDWILSCQHPAGGFCGSPNHRFPDAYYVDVGFGKPQMDPGNLPATFFALLSLCLVVGGDGDEGLERPFERVRRRQCLEWLRSVQRADGSFGELVGKGGRVEGGSDMRYCYFAAAVRWILKDGDEVKDIDVEKLVGHIRSGQTYDGGISESSQHEAHAGYTYCATAALSLLNRLPSLDSVKSKSVQQINGTSETTLAGLTNLPSTIRWLVSRQIGYSEDDESNEQNSPLDQQDQREALAGFHKDAEPLSMASLEIDETQFIGFNGRCNKLADTCYSFWVTASLDILGQAQLVNAPSIRRFLLEQAQHRIGGFGKYPGNPPDIYHSYLALAALATIKEQALKDFDPVLCISKEVREKIEKLR